jgi:hypothetical protein
MSLARHALEGVRDIAIGAGSARRPTPSFDFADPQSVARIFASAARDGPPPTGYRH